MKKMKLCDGKKMMKIGCLGMCKYDNNKVAQ